MSRLRPRRRISRTVIAALLSAAAFAALLVAWFASGWGEVRARQKELEAEPTLEARRTEETLARDLRLELSRVLGRENARDYYYYGNLYHDPRAVNSWSVTPSPLASGPDDPLIRGHFQITPSGAVTTPTINDDVPELSEQETLEDNRAFRNTVRESLSKRLLDNGTLVAELAPKLRPQAQVKQQTKTQKVDPSTYTQNSNANAVFIEQQRLSPKAPPEGKQVRRQPVVADAAAKFKGADAPIAITISSFEWRTEALSGAPALIATRHVDTPDGRLVQGFVVERARLASWLAARAGETPVALAAPSADVPDATGSEIAPGWTVTASIQPAALESAKSAASAVAHSFIFKFVGVGLVSALAFILVVILVARAEQLARERSQFAAAAAHELRTPLAGLQLYGDMLSDGLGDPGKLSDYARRMSEEASRLGRVVSNVLGFSQLERGNLSIDARPGDLGKTLCELAERTQPTLDRAGVVIDLDVPPELRATFDRDAVTRIVGNLIDNAEKYSREADDRTIAVRAAATKHEGLDAVEVVVSDHGPGVPAIARPKLFKPFARGVSTDGPAGLGLGLALSQSLARAMGGDLEYRESNTGASFVLRLRA